MTIATDDLRIWYGYELDLPTYFYFHNLDGLSVIGLDYGNGMIDCFSFLEKINCDDRKIKTSVWGRRAEVVKEYLAEKEACLEWSRKLGKSNLLIKSFCENGVKVLANPENVEMIFRIMETIVKEDLIHKELIEQCIGVVMSSKNFEENAIDSSYRGGDYSTIAAFFDFVR